MGPKGLVRAGRSGVATSPDLSTVSRQVGGVAIGLAGAR